MTDSLEHDPFYEIVDEFVERRRRGENPPIDDYARQYPRWADRIRDLFPSLEGLEGIAQAGPVPEPHELRELGDYTIVREIGRGGMGIVYEARQRSLDRRVALKVLPVQATLDPRFLERFKREAQTAASLQHPNIVPVYGVDEAEGIHFYAMQFIEGHGLDEILRERLKGSPGQAERRTSFKPVEQLAHELATMPKWSSGDASQRTGTDTGSSSGTAGSRDIYFRSVARVGLDVARGLAFAHARGILHRDIKPSNLLLDKNRRVWIGDFGLCKKEGSTELTHTGDVVGTLRYMAPEQLSGNADARSDVYGLGITLYELLTARPAFDEKERGKLVRLIFEKAPAQPRVLDKAIPRDLETIVLKAIEKLPEARYPSADAIAEDLRAFLERRPVTARRPTFWYLLRLAVRRNKVLASTIATALVLLTLATALYVVDVTDQNRRVRALGLAHASADTMAKDPMLALLLARKGFETDPSSPETLSQLYRSLSAIHERKILHFEHIVISVDYSPSGDLFLTSTDDGFVHLWDADSGFLRKFPVHDTTQALRGGFQYRDLSGPTRFSPNGKEILSWGTDGTARRWNLDGERIAELPHGGVVYHAAYHPKDPSLVVTTSSLGTAIIWGNDVPLVTLEGHTDQVITAAFSPDGEWIVTGSRDRTARLWRFSGSAAELVAVMDEPTSTVTSAVFSPDGKRVLTACGAGLVHNFGKGDRTAYLWDLRGEVTARFEHFLSIESVAFAPDGSEILTASYDGTAKLWNLDGTLLQTYTMGSRARMAAYSGDKIVIGCNTGAMWVFGRQSSEPIATLLGHEATFQYIAVAPRGQTILTSARDHTARLWQLEPVEFPVFGGHQRYMWGTQYSADGTKIVTYAMDRTIRVWDSHGALLREFPPLETFAYYASFSPDSSRILALSFPTLDVWTLDGRNLLHTDVVASSACFTPGGDGIMLAGVVDVVFIDLSGKETSRFPVTDEYPVMSAVYSPDQTMILTASDRARLHDLEGKVIRTFAGDTSTRITVARFSLSGDKVVTAANDATVKVWSLDGTLLLNLPHEGAVWVALFSPDGQTILTVSAEQVARVWDLEGKLLYTLQDHRHGINWADFSPDGRHIVTAMLDGTARLWPTDLDELTRFAESATTRPFSEIELTTYSELLGGR